MQTLNQSTNACKEFLSFFFIGDCDIRLLCELSGKEKVFYIYKNTANIELFLYETNPHVPIEYEILIREMKQGKTFCKIVVAVFSVFFFLSIPFNCS